MAPIAAAEPHAIKVAQQWKDVDNGGDVNAYLNKMASRRSFLRFIAGSPLLLSLGLSACSEEKRLWERLLPEELLKDTAHMDDLITSPDRALNVFDFEAVAREKLLPSHYGFIATGVDANATLLANREGFAKVRIRARRLVDVSSVDMTTELFGVKHETPIVLAPAGGQLAFHPKGEIATARAARTRRHLQILSTISTTSVGAVAEARGEPVWFQLYPTSDWKITQRLLELAEAAGCPVIVLTVDLPASSNKETLQRFKRNDREDCDECHESGFKGFVHRRLMFEGLDLGTLPNHLAPGLTWDFLRRLREHTQMKLVIKGIVTHEDASLCLEHGVDGIIVSNHGGRAEESGVATIESLPEVVKAVGGRVPVMMDSGIRRGTDIFKALALGADAICIGRPYLWGLAAFGQAGVEGVLDILRKELELVMKLAGTPSLKDINSNSVAHS